MRYCGLIPVVAFFTMLAVPVKSLSFAVDTVKQVPVYDEFDENEVNGAVIVNLPEKSVADVLITFDSPEVTDEPYYRTTLNGSGSYSFDIEGRDNSKDDYRNYKINIEITGGEYNITSSAFIDEITVPDVDGTPDSYIEYVYNFTVDGEKSENEWDIVSQNVKEKNIAVHLDYIIKGDVDGNGVADASDASYVLAEYAVKSTGGASSFNSRQTVQADVNSDSAVDANDASMILAYYSANSTGGNADWDEILS